MANKYKELVQKAKAMKGDGKVMMEELKEENLGVISDTKDVGTEATDAAINGDGRKEELMKEDVRE